MFSLKLEDKITFNSILAFLGGASLLWSIVYTLPLLLSIEFSVTFLDVVYFLVISFPFFISLALIGAIYIKFISQYVFWLSIVYWLYIIFGELAEGQPYEPSLYAIGAIFVVVVASISGKIISNKCA